jgi:GNAT superfamily N-acetyltransferase
MLKEQNRHSLELNTTRFIKLETDRLHEANRIIEQCVMSWNLPDKVKRLSLPGYRYKAEDLDYLMIFAAVDNNDQQLGVVALEYDLSVTLPGKRNGLLLHGLYVEPAFQGQGLGKTMTDFALTQSLEQGFGGIWVKAQADANDFFAKAGFEKLPIIDPARDYPHRWWKSAG